MLKFVAIAFLLLAPMRWIYVVDKQKCNGCGNCLSHCPQGALTMSGPDAYIDPELCDGCGICVNYCPRNAIYKVWYTGIEDNETNDAILTFSHNPVSGTSVTVTGIPPETEVVVMDSSGRMIIRDTADQQGQLILDMSSVPVGAYLVISTGGVSVLTSI